MGRSASTLSFVVARMGCVLARDTILCVPRLSYLSYLISPILLSQTKKDSNLIEPAAITGREFFLEGIVLMRGIITHSVSSMRLL